jgi:hypothetical protein
MGVNNVPTKGNPSDTKRCSVVVTIAADGFFVFKGAQGGPVKRSLDTLNVKGCCQRKWWFDELVARKWVEAIIEPYVREV